MINPNCQFCPNMNFTGELDSDFLKISYGCSINNGHFAINIVVMICSTTLNDNVRLMEISKCQMSGCTQDYQVIRNKWIAIKKKLLIFQQSTIIFVSKMSILSTFKFHPIIGLRFFWKCHIIILWKFAILRNIYLIWLIWVGMTA